MDVSIVVPVCNEAGNVLPLTREVLAALRGEPWSFELVFVDDASSDDTWARIQEARQLDARVRGLRHRRNAGQSAAVWTGLRATSSPLLATLDGDLQNDPADLPRLLRELQQADCVNGLRLARNDTFVRRVSSRLARWARRAVLKADFRDTGCGIRAFKRAVVEAILPFNGFHRFLPILAHGAGFTVREVPVNHRARVAGRSKYGVWNRLGRGLFDLVGVGWFLKRRIGSVPFSESP